MTGNVGRYEILDKIGEGGFAIVYRGRDTQLDRLVALKELRPALLKDAAWVNKFRQEAKTVARLDHPHIVTIHDVYQTADRLFLVMALVDGPSLDVLLRQKRLSWAEAMSMITAVAQGLDYAHANDILHRDLKPANILLDSKRGPMLSDFGLAKLATEYSLSSSGTIVGTPHYIAPEIWEGQQFTPQADIYALGCIIFEMITGEKAFKGDTPPAIMMAHFKPLVMPQVWPAGVPPQLTDILLKTLTANPTDRFPNANDLVQTLKSFNGGPTDTQPSSQDNLDLTVPPSTTPSPVNPSSEVASSSPQPANQPYEREKAVSDLLLHNQQLQEQVELLKETLTKEREATEEKLKAVTTPVPTPSPFPQPTPSPWVTKKSNCLWFSALFGLIFTGLVVIGFGFVCSSLENMTNSLVDVANNSVLAETIGNILPDVEIGETVTEAINLPRPTTEEVINLVIDFDSGELFISPAEETDLSTAPLIAGQAIYNAQQLKPDIISDTEIIRLQTEIGLGLAGFTKPDLRNIWELKIGSSLLNLTIDIEAVQRTNIELGGLAITNLTINEKTSDGDISFSQPNQVPMTELQVNGITSDIDLIGLANSRAEKIIINGGLGNHKLDFSGELQEDMTVIVMNDVNQLTIVVPENIKAQLVVDEEDVEVNTKGAWQKEGNDHYRIPGEGPQITINVEMEDGNLRLRNL